MAEPDHSRLREAAKLVIRDVVALREGEEVLIIANMEGDSFDICTAFYNEALAAGGKVVMMVVPEMDRYDVTPRIMCDVTNAKPDVLFSLRSKGMGQDLYGAKIGYVGRDGGQYTYPHLKVIRGDRRTRGVWGGYLTREMFERCVLVDYPAMQELARRLKAVIDPCKELRIATPAGTDVAFSIDGCPTLVDAGDFTIPGSGGNLPCGEVFIGPVPGSGRGTIVFDGQIDLSYGSMIPISQVKITLRDGYVDQVIGGPEADLLLDVIVKGERMASDRSDREAERNARHIGEIGIGINYNALATGDLMEAEKAGGTVHLAIGDDVNGKATAFIHHDCLMLHPSVWVDGRLIMKDGDIQL